MLKCSDKIVENRHHKDLDNCKLRVTFNMPIDVSKTQVKQTCANMF